MTLSRFDTCICLFNRDRFSEMQNQTKPFYLLFCRLTKHLFFLQLILRIFQALRTCLAIANCKLRTTRRRKQCERCVLSWIVVASKGAPSQRTLIALEVSGIDPKVLWVYSGWGIPGTNNKELKVLSLFISLYFACFIHSLRWSGNIVHLFVRESIYPLTFSQVSFASCERLL